MTYRWGQSMRGAHGSSAPLAGLRVMHLSTVHRGGDQRIAWKEGLALVAAGASVIVAARAGGDVPEGIERIALPSWFERLGRPARVATGWLVGIVLLLRQRPDVVHVHDPELAILARPARMLGIGFIYDAHEDLVRQIQRKTYLNGMARRLATRISKRMLERTGRTGSGIVSATPLIASSFGQPRKTIVFRNLPFDTPTPRDNLPSGSAGERTDELIILGGITRSRGVDRVARAVAALPDGFDVRLVLAGAVESGFLTELRSICGERLEHVGVLDRAQVWGALARATLGLCILPPFEDYEDAYPVKLFEYMSAGLPVVVSDYGEMKDLVSRSGAGVSVDPLDVSAMTDAIAGLLGDRIRLDACAANAVSFMKSGLGFSADRERLVGLYETIMLGRSRTTRGRAR